MGRSRRNFLVKFKVLHNPFASLLVTALMLLIVLVPRAHAAVSAGFGDPCDPVSGSGISFLGIPPWYKYLPGKVDGSTEKQNTTIDKNTGTKVDGSCIPQLNKEGSNGGIDLVSIWLIGLAVVEILLRLAGMITVGMVIFGGFKFITSQGNSDATKNARGTIINAFIGLVITIIAAISVNFIAVLLEK
jgi:hypothetical protein